MEIPRFAFLGTPKFAEIILDELAQKGFAPSLIITAPDKPKGRKLLITPSEVAVWGDARNISVLKPQKLSDPEFIEKLKAANCALFIVAAYGKIIPKTVLDMPKHGTLNVHPSLLPKFRGPSPIEFAILSDEAHTGVSIMLLDEEMDHGPIVAQRERIIKDWPPKGSVLTEDLAHQGGALLAEIIPEWIAGMKAAPQDHSRATFTKKFTKEDALIDPSEDALRNFKKIRAFDGSAHFTTSRNGKQIRVRIADAEYKNDALTITRVVPEGKKEMPYEDFLRGNR